MKKNIEPDKEEFRELQNLDTKAEKRQMWMQSILVKTESNQWRYPIQQHWVLERPHLGPLVVVQWEAYSGAALLKRHQLLTLDYQAWEHLHQVQAIEFLLPINQASQVTNRWSETSNCNDLA